MVGFFFMKQMLLFIHDSNLRFNCNMLGVTKDSTCSNVHSIVSDALNLSNLSVIYISSNVSNYFHMWKENESSSCKTEPCGSLTPTLAEKSF